ncbi:MAG: hypothetical protein C0625_06635 [Arcobacter sp.]|nr:MAG: hypothetical protein C0625_06635 [Arcobacter sp.]
MNPLQYTSEEMFSSTELIRKSKMVFDKLHKKDIEKAIILRDGKPSFMLLDFSEYEKIMTEYILLKQKSDSTSTKIKKEVLINHSNDKVEKIKSKDKTLNQLDEKDLEEALAQIDNLDLENLEDSPSIDSGINIAKQEKEPLKEFWE